MIEPTFDRVLIQKQDFEEVTDSGIVLATSKKKEGKENVQRGVIIAAGAGRVFDSGHFEPTKVKPGDKVIFDEEAAYRVTDLGSDYLILREAQILGVLK